MAQLFKKINKNVSVIRNLPEPKWEFKGSRMFFSFKLSLIKAHALLLIFGHFAGLRRPY